MEEGRALLGSSLSGDTTLPGGLFGGALASHPHPRRRGLLPSPMAEAERNPDSELPAPLRLLVA